jgi:hypothetical protein
MVRHGRQPHLPGGQTAHQDFREGRRLGGILPHSMMILITMVLSQVGTSETIAGDGKETIHDDAGCAPLASIERHGPAIGKEGKGTRKANGVHDIVERRKSRLQDGLIKAGPDFRVGNADRPGSTREAFQLGRSEEARHLAAEGGDQASLGTALRRTVFRDGNRRIQDGRRRQPRRVAGDGNRSGRRAGNGRRGLQMAGRLEGLQDARVVGQQEAARRKRKADLHVHRNMNRNGSGVVVRAPQGQEVEVRVREVRVTRSS